MLDATDVPTCLRTKIVLRRQADTGLHAHGACIKLNDTIRQFGKPQDQMSEDSMLACANGHATLGTSQSLMPASTGTVVPHNLTHSTSATLRVSQRFIAPSTSTGLAQDLTDSWGSTLGSLQSVVPALSNGLGHDRLSGQVAIDEPAVSCEPCNEQLFQHSIQEVTTGTHHHQQCQQPNPSCDRAGQITTLIIRNIPMSCTTSMLLDEIHRDGFEGVYNFFYRPVDHQSRHQRLCAFVNFATPTIATAFYLRMHGRVLECGHDQSVPLEVLAAKEQGFESNTIRYFTRKCEKRHKFRAQPIFPDIDSSQVQKVEARARRLLIEEPTAAVVDARVCSSTRQSHAQDHKI